MPRTLLSSLFLLLGLTVLNAQNQYTVEVGAFQDVKQSDFADLLAFGFVYGNKVADNVHQVYMGTYDDLSKAEALSTQLKARGFNNARVLQRPAGQNVLMIQLATKVVGTPLNYVELQKAGNVFIEQTAERLKIMTGVYPDANAANAALPAIRQLGYKDAFIKSLDFNRLIPVTAFETGIKAPLIPINLSNQPAVPSPYEQPAVATYGNQPEVNQPTTNPAPVTYGNTPSAPATTAPAVGTTLPKATLPNIRSRFKRQSATWLQTVLKEKGFYTGVIDGYYGNGTKTAFDQAWANQDDIQKYQALVPLMALPTTDVVARWPSIATLLAISHDMAAGMEDVQLAAQSLDNRQRLYVTRQPLTPAEATRAQNWAATLWANLDGWAAEDPTHARTMSAFRIAYYQSQVLLEDYYMDKGFAADQAKDLALASLQNLVGADLERFLY